MKKVAVKRVHTLPRPKPTFHDNHIRRRNDLDAIVGRSEAIIKAIIWVFAGVFSKEEEDLEKS